MLRRLTLFLAVIALSPVMALAGLDVIAYSHLVRVQHPRVDRDGEPLDQEAQVRLEPVNFPERFRGLEAGAIYRFASQFEFGAGPYSDYNRWRNDLAEIAGYEAVEVMRPNGESERRYDEGAWSEKAGPFWELINFSDSEGVLGPVVSRKLHLDFVAFRKRAMVHPSPEFREQYKNWQKAFALAAQHGAVKFQ